MAEQHFIVGGDAEKIAKILLRFLGDLDEFFATVANFHHRRAKTVPVAKILLSQFKYFCR